jgi:hypothetical protein
MGWQSCGELFMGGRQSVSSFAERGYAQLRCCAPWRGSILRVEIRTVGERS